MCSIMLHTHIFNCTGLYGILRIVLPYYTFGIDEHYRLLWKKRERVYKFFIYSVCQHKLVKA